MSDRTVLNFYRKIRPPLLLRLKCLLVEFHECIQMARNSLRMMKPIHSDLLPSTDRN